MKRRFKAQKITNAQWKQVTKLEDEANALHRKVKTHESSMLLTAKRCGEKLIAIAKIVGRYRLKKWIASNDRFDINSYRTASDYMYVAKHWQDKEVQKAIAQGAIRSINSYLKIVRDKRKREKRAAQGLDEAKKDRATIEKELASMNRDAIRKMFAERLKNELANIDLVYLTDYETFDDLWERFYARLRDIICRELEYDPYQYEEREKFYQRYKDMKKKCDEGTRKILEARNPHLKRPQRPTLLPEQK